MKKCPYCTAEIAREARKCMYCGEWVEGGHAAPAPGPAELQVTVRPPSQGPTKACPYCSAQIPEDAWTCMYCKRGVFGGRPLAIFGAVVGLLIAAIFFFGFWLPGFLEVQKKHKEFDEKFDKQRKEFDKNWKGFPDR